ncbi:MAG: hypothetical protein GWM98_04810 [Nitrospinaceae bacterium]|nr:hypothetical protein [Nitrospinaceae bacterium]
MKQPIRFFLAGRIPTQQAVGAELPDIPALCDGLFWGFWYRGFCSGVGIGGGDQCLKLFEREPEGLKELGIFGAFQIREDFAEHIKIPLGELPGAIIRDRVSGCFLSV